MGPFATIFMIIRLRIRQNFMSSLWYWQLVFLFSENKKGPTNSLNISLVWCQISHHFSESRRNFRKSLAANWAQREMAFCSVVFGLKDFLRNLGFQSKWGVHVGNISVTQNATKSLMTPIKYGRLDLSMCQCVNVDENSMRPRWNRNIKVIFLYNRTEDR